MYTLKIVLLTLLFYSIISGTLYYLSGEEEIVLTIFGAGIFWVMVSFLMECIICPIIENIKHITHRTIIKDPKGNKFYCKNKNAMDVLYHDFIIVKRHAKRNEWKELPTFAGEDLEYIKMNCYRCKNNKKCNRSSEVQCSHDEYGEIIDFDMFERRGFLE